MDIETVKIKPTDPEQGEYVLINKDDFDPQAHALYGEPETDAPRRGRPPGKKPQGE